MGNFGLYFGNWGQRASSALTPSAEKKERTATYSRPIPKNLAQVVVLCEANASLEELLEQPPVPGTPGAEGLEGKATHEHWVVRGSEDQAAVLIAARKDNTTSLESLEYEVYSDHTYTEKGKPKQARSRMLVCTVGFKQNVGHLGKEMVFCGVHGHYRTMKKEWPTAWDAFWDRFASVIKLIGVHFMVGDFNMSLTEVPKELRSRGIEWDCVAWYLWQYEPGDTHHLPSLGLDS